MELRLLSAVCTAIYIYSNAAMAVSFMPLGDLAGGGFYSSAHGVSADGSVVIGFSGSSLGTEAFRWTSEGGMVGLGDLPGGEFYSEAHDVSADGSVVVGLGFTATPGSEAFRWTREDGMVGLGYLRPEDDPYSEASGVSADGLVVVGGSTSAFDPTGAGGREAFRWTSEGGMVGLGDLPGGWFYSYPYGVSADGSVVVGQSQSALGWEAFRWTREGGMQSVASILTWSVDLTGWILESANGVSADGYTIVGQGINPDGFMEAWIADLSVAPPATTPVDLSGTIKTPDDMDICAMVLASGQFMFSCNPSGVFSLEDLPRENDGTVKCQMYANGFFPEINILTESASAAAVVMTRSGACPSYNTTYDPGFFPDSAGKRIDISGSVLLQDTQTPICAMLLANGQYMFSCDGTGSYELNIPLDTNGQFKLQVYADGFAPTIQTFDEFHAINDVRMARAVECL